MQLSQAQKIIIYLFEKFSMKAKITSALLWLFESRLIFFLLLCFTPFAGILLAFFEVSPPHIYLIESIGPICALLIALFSIGRRRTAYFQLNLILLNLVFILPYSLLNISLLNFLFDLKSFPLSILMCLSFLSNVVFFNRLTVPRIENKHILGKIRDILINICLSFYLLPFLLYNFNFFLNSPRILYFIFAITFSIIALFYLLEFLRSYTLYRKQKAGDMYRNQRTLGRFQGKVDFLLLSQVLAWNLLGIGLNVDIQKWYIPLIFLIPVSVSYAIASFKSLKESTKASLAIKIGRFLMMCSLFLAFFTFFEIYRSETAYNFLFSFLVYFMLFGNIIYGSFLSDSYEKGKILMYLGILCGMFFIIGALPSDFVSEIPPVGDEDAALNSLTAVIQSLATVFAILVTFITFVFAYTWAARGSTNAEEKTYFENPNLAILFFTLGSTLSLGYRLLKTISLAFRTIASFQRNMPNERFVPVEFDSVSETIRQTQASLCIALFYISTVVFILFIYNILPRIPPGRILPFQD